MFGPPRKHLKMNIVPEGGAQSAPVRPRGAFGGPPKRRGGDWGRKAVLAMKALTELDPRYRGNFQQQQDLYAQQDFLASQEADKARRDAAMAKFGKELTPQQQALFAIAPDAVIGAKAEQMFATPEGPSFADQLAARKFEHEKRMDKEELHRDSLPQSPEWVDIETPPGMQGVWQENTKTGAKKRVAGPPSNGISIDKDGNITIGGPNGGATTRYTAAQDASQLAEARDRANQLTPVLNTMYAARSELLGPDGKEGTEDDLDTGSFAGPMQMLRRALPGEQTDETRYDNLDALSKEFGIEKLAGIGGNDTERELLTAIQTGPNIGAQEGSNLSRLNRQIAVFEFIGESRRNFMSRWQQDHGSLSQPARSGPYSGMTFDEALSVFQRTEAQRQNLLGAAPSGQSEAGSPVGVMPQQGDLTDAEYQEYLALKREVEG